MSAGHSLAALVVASALAVAGCSAAPASSAGRWPPHRPPRALRQSPPLQPDWTLRRRRRSPWSWFPAQRTPRSTGSRSTLPGGHQGRPRLHRGDHRLLLGDRGHARAGQGLPCLRGGRRRGSRRSGPYLPALEKVNGSASHAGLGAGFEAAWKAAAADPAFQTAQDAERDRVYFDRPSLRRRPTVWAPWASSSTTTRWSCTARATTRPASAASAPRRWQGARPQCRRGRDQLPHGVLHRPDQGDEVRGGARRHVPHRRRPEGLPEGRKPEPRSPAGLEDLRRRLSHP